jgi:hypothetical protein
MRSRATGPRFAQKDAGMWLGLLMLALLVGLFALCAALVRFAEGVVGPRSD